MEGYGVTGGAKYYQAETKNEAIDQKMSSSLLSTTEENAKRISVISERLVGIADRICGSRPRETVSGADKVGPIGGGLQGRLSNVNTRTAHYLDECDRALNTLESFV